MNDFIKLLIKESISTIEGLTGFAPEIKEQEALNADQQIEQLFKPLAIAEIETTGDENGHLKIAISSTIITALGEMMMGEEELSGKVELEADDLDAAKEIISNIYGSFSTSLGAQKDLPNLSFSVQKVIYSEDTRAVDVSAMQKVYVCSIELQGIKGEIIYINDSIIERAIGGEVAKPAESPANNAKSELNSEEMKNISLIMDVRLPVRVRIGSKKMLLKDVLSMDIGSVIELNQLANDPLEILVGDKVIALGEVVIIDGNFGVQITEIGTKRERLEQLR